MKNNLKTFSDDVIDVLVDSGKFIVNNENKVICSELFTKILDGSKSDCEDKSEDIKRYRSKIQTLSEENAVLSSENKRLTEENEKYLNEINNIEGVEDRKADQLIAVIKDEPTAERKYITVINTELNQYDTIYQLVGRSIQKLYSIKGLEAAQYIFSNNTFTLNDEPVRNDTVINNKAYDIVIDEATVNEKETEYINKLYILFSHFSDVKFRCKTIGTLKDTTNKDTTNKEENITDEETKGTAVIEESTVENEVETNEEEEVLTETEIEDNAITEGENIIEEDELSPEELVGGTTDNLNDTLDDIVGTDEVNLETEENNIESDSDLFGTFEEEVPSEESIEENTESNSDAFDNIDFSDFGKGENTEEEEINIEETLENNESEPEPNSDINLDELLGDDTPVSDDDILADEEDAEIDFGDDIDFGDNETDNNLEEPEVKDEDIIVIEEPELCAIQFDELVDYIWNKDITFGEIKYISNDTPDNPMSDLVFKINDTDTNKNTVKEIDALLAIGVKTNVEEGRNIISLIRTIDLSNVNNFISLITDETIDYTRINNTKYAIAPLENVRQGFSILKDIADQLKINTNDIFIYMDVNSESEDGKRFIEEHKFNEDDIVLSENIEYIRPDDYNEEEDANDAIVIVRGDLFDNIVVTMNSINAMSKIVKCTIAVKTAAIGIVLRDKQSVNSAIAEFIFNAIEDGREVNAARIGNVLGENYRIISFDENDVSVEHTSIETKLGDIFISSLEQWQILHAMIKLQSTLFNNKNIVLKSIIDIDALNFYGEEFKTAEPSLSVAIQSFTDYISTHIKNEG